MKSLDQHIFEMNRAKIKRALVADRRKRVISDDSLIIVATFAACVAVFALAAYFIL